MNKEYYRVEPHYEEYYPTSELIFFVYSVVKETPKGVWIKLKGYEDCTYQRKRFILNTSRKKYAYPSKEEALYSFIKRKEIQIKILSRKLSDTEDLLKLANYYNCEEIKEYE